MPKRSTTKGKTRHDKKRLTKTVLLYESIGFGIVILLLWADEVFDLPHHILGAPAVEAVVPMKGMNTGVQLILKSDKETIPVHMGPGWYIERLDTKIKKGDKVEIRGSRINFGGKPAIIAAEIRKGNAALMLRDSSGIPVWAGWRR